MARLVGQFTASFGATKMHRLTFVMLSSAALAAFSLSGTALGASAATYEVKFERTWSDTTHPLNWPGSGAHFPGAIGATHNGRYAMFVVGGTATPGLQALAEKGATS